MILEVSVGECINALFSGGLFKPVSGLQGLGRLICQPTVQRLGVALTGSTAHMESDRVQLLGLSEQSYLQQQPAEIADELLEKVVSIPFPMLIISAGQTPSAKLIELSDRHSFVLLATPLSSAHASHRINQYLSRRLAPRESRHGVLVDVHGVGILLLGKCGIGKSEVALELLASGHRLVSDDLVLLEKEAEDHLVGVAPQMTRHHIEIRGLGILNVKDLFGAAAVRDRKRVELVVELVEWDNDTHYERLGLDTHYTQIAGVKVEHITLPVRSGRSLSLIIEVAARNHLLRLQGTHSASAFAERLRKNIAAGFTPRDAIELGQGEEGYCE
ncbi:HPr(Ser) kinase/phosphatase [Myxococcota bacterium]|nr:HPr(Ser) kinase/phosphatase [Myxococcota bacterium]MBU1432953.1 HPr(Ser) kinase/phosphatase [Myxococcota bacterium]MBU1896307.1 HPr(Ser) kinase/phosphatase [Myxococcota bacterium]